MDGIGQQIDSCCKKIRPYCPISNHIIPKAIPGWNNKIHFMGMRGIYKIFHTRKSDSEIFKTILYGLNSPAMSIIWQKIVCLILFCLKAFIFLQSWKKRDPYIIFCLSLNLSLESGFHVPVIIPPWAIQWTLTSYYTCEIETFTVHKLSDS